MRRPLLNNSHPGQVLYDPFLGSGTTLIAAETTGRICFGIEIEPLYVDVAIRRWQAFTGREATLSPEGPTYAAVQAARSASEKVPPASSEAPPRARRKRPPAGPPKPKG